VKLPEFLQAAYQKVVEWFFRPVLTFRIVELFDEVEYSFVISPSACDRGHNFFNIVFFRLFDVVRLPEYLRCVRWCSLLAGSLGCEQRNVEDVVDLPFAMQHEADGQRGNDLLNLEGTIIFVVQLLRRQRVLMLRPLSITKSPTW